MINRNIIRVSEFEKLFYDDSKPFKQKHWESLCHYLEQRNKNEEKKTEFYRILNKGIQFTNFVGVIQAGDLTIEVLPKTDHHRTSAANSTLEDLLIKDNADASSKQSWHEVLLQMLKECKLLTINHIDYANLRLKSNSILDIYIELFLAETEKIIHEGLVKKYIKKEGNSLSMKGQLLFNKHINKNFVHQERFYIRYTEYNRANIFNQLLYKTLKVIPFINNNPSVTDRLNRLLLDFPEMPDCKVSQKTFSKLTYDRKTERYKEALLIAKMLLLNYRPDISGGTENVMAILFDMNKLWEEFVYRRLVKCAKEGVSVSRQNRKQFWYNEDSNFHKHVQPDILITKNNQRIVLDTKWKIVNNNRPDDDDLKQMFVYNLLWNANRSFLVYPGTYSMCKGSYLHFELSRKHTDSKDEYFNHCSLAFINLLPEIKGPISNVPFENLLRDFFN